MESNKNKSILQIDPRFCTFCGTCVGICPNNALVARDGHILLRGKCDSCGLCYKFCPGIEIDLPLMSNNLFDDSNPDAYFGHYHSIWVAHSMDSKVRSNASSGGVVTSLLVYLLDAGKIDGAIVVGIHPQRAWDYDVKIARTREEIYEASQSKYKQIPLNTILKKINQLDGKYAIVGLPCHIHGIRKLQIARSKDACKIHYCIGLYCGFNMHYQATEDLINKLGVKKKDIISLQYRGGVHPGGFLLKTQNSEKLLDKSYYNVYNLLYVPSRCLLCMDLTNELADISVGDIWLEKYTGGWSSVIIRSKDGHAIFTEALEKGYLNSDAISRDDLSRSHAHLLKHKKENAAIRLKYSAIKPDYGLNLAKPNLKQHAPGILSLVFLIALQSRVTRGIVKILPLNAVRLIANTMNKVIRKGRH